MNKDDIITYKNERFVFIYNKFRQEYQENADFFITIKGLTKEVRDIIEFDSDYFDNTVVENFSNIPKLVSVSGIYKVDCNIIQDYNDDIEIIVNSIELLFDISKI